MEKLTERLFPFLAWARRSDSSSLKSDFFAGITNALIVLPQGVAFSMVAGLPPEYGLYTAIIPPIIAALFGSSLHLISGPTMAISIVIFSSISSHAKAGSPEFISLVLTLTILVGVIQLLLGLARFGALVNFISHTVVIGFTAGAALLIGTSQIRHCLGISLAIGESFFGTWVEIVGKLGETNLPSVFIALVTMAIFLLLKRFRPGWPSMLYAMIGGGVATYLLGADEHNIELVSLISFNFPLLSMPDFSPEVLSSMIPSAFAVAMLGLIEAVSIARSVALKSGQRIDGNQEFVGQGLSNIVGSFFSCYASAGSFTRTGINYSSGAKTPLAAIFAAFFLCFILVGFGSLTAYIPLPALGGIILIVAYNLIDFKYIKKLITSEQSELSVMLITFLATITVQLEFAIYIGMIFSLVLYLNKTSKPKIVPCLPDSSTPGRHFKTASRRSVCPQLQILRIDGSIYFGSINHIEQALQYSFDKDAGGRKRLLIISSGINFIDMSGIEMFSKIVNKAKEAGGEIYFYGLKANTLAVMEKCGLVEKIGSDNIFPAKDIALKTIYAKLNKGICYLCDEEIFIECGYAGKKGLRPK